MRETAAAVIQPAPDAALEAYEVSPAVNRTANDVPALLDPLREPEVIAAGREAEAREEGKRSDEGRRRAGELVLRARLMGGVGASARSLLLRVTLRYGVIGRPSSHFA